MKRREFITIVGALAAAWLSDLRAQQRYERFIPFLIDIPGYTGRLPLAPGKTIMNGALVIAAWREYLRRDARFYASILWGNVHLATSKAHTSTIEGFQVHAFSTPYVVIEVMLSSAAVFQIMSPDLSEDEATAIAQKFDWKGIHALVY